LLGIFAIILGTRIILQFPAVFYEKTVYPEPDYSVKQLKKEQAAFQVCRGLIEAYQQGEASGGSIDWEDLDQLLPLALEALTKKSLAR
jgi:hypothetical protein